MGNDTRVHRIAPLPQYVFEIDAEKTQQHKLKNHVLNEKVVFVPVNFEEESWKDKLHAIAGEEVTPRKALFIWDGVTYYHQQPFHVPAGSRVVFDVNNPTPTQLKLPTYVFRIFGGKWYSVFDEPSWRGLLKEFSIELDGELLNAASNAFYSFDPAFEGKVRLPGHPSEKSFHPSFILIASVPTKDSVSLF